MAIDISEYDIDRFTEEQKHVYFSMLDEIITSNKIVNPISGEFIDDEGNTYTADDWDDAKCVEIFKQAHEKWVNGVDFESYRK